MSDTGDWGKALRGDLLARWPKDENGEPEEPVRLGTAINLNLVDELTVSMLEACGIPCLTLYPGAWRRTPPPCAPIREITSWKTDRVRGFENGQYCIRR